MAPINRQKICESTARYRSRATIEPVQNTDLAKFHSPVESLFMCFDFLVKDFRTREWYFVHSLGLVNERVAPVSVKFTNT